MFSGLSSSPIFKLVVAHRKHKTKVYIECETNEPEQIAEETSRGIITWKIRQGFLAGHCCWPDDPSWTVKYILTPDHYIAYCFDRKVLNSRISVDVQECTAAICKLREAILLGGLEE